MTSVVDWAVQASAFEADGSLRDIYVLDATIDDWRVALALLARRFDPLSLRRADAEIAIPDRIEELFMTESGALLLFHVGEVELACHFFSTSQIELDFWPDDVGEVELHDLLDLMTALGDATGKVVVLTPENGPDAPWFRYDPTARAMSWLP